METSGVYNDRGLFSDIAAGSEQAFRILFDQYRDELYKVGLQLTKSQVVAEEVIQEVFISLWISREHLAVVEEPAAYLYRILFNKVSHYLKKETNRERIIRDAMRFGPTFSNATEHAIAESESKRLIEQAITRLPPQQRQVYRLCRLQGWTKEETAAELNISTHTVKSHLSKALAFIREYLRNEAALAALLILWSGKY